MLHPSNYTSRYIGDRIDIKARVYTSRVCVRDIQLIDSNYYHIITVVIRSRSK